MTDYFVINGQASWQNQQSGVRTHQNADHPAYQHDQYEQSIRVIDVCMLKNIDHQLYSEKQRNSGVRLGGCASIFYSLLGLKLLVKCKTLDAVYYQCTRDGKLFLAQNEVVVVFFKSVNFD